MKAKGQLKHHFWGDYACTIVLYFERDVPLDAVRTLLGDGWEAGRSEAFQGLRGHGGSAWLDGVKAKLGAWGADVRAIDSCAKSIDYGEPFECEVPIPFHALAEHAGQGRLL